MFILRCLSCGHLLKDKCSNNDVRYLLVFAAFRWVDEFCILFLWNKWNNMENQISCGWMVKMFVCHSFIWLSLHVASVLLSTMNGIERLGTIKVVLDPKGLGEWRCLDERSSRKQQRRRPSIKYLSDVHTIVWRGDTLSSLTGRLFLQLCDEDSILMSQPTPSSHSKSYRIGNSFVLSLIWVYFCVPVLFRQVGNLLMENAQLALQSDSMKSRAADIQARSAVFGCSFPESSFLLSIWCRRSHPQNMLRSFTPLMSEAIRYREGRYWFEIVKQVACKKKCDWPIKPFQHTRHMLNDKHCYLPRSSFPAPVSKPACKSRLGFVPRQHFHLCIDA